MGHKREGCNSMQEIASIGVYRMNTLKVALLVIGLPFALFIVLAAIERIAK
jgi:hypothetical protein